MRSACVSILCLCAFLPSIPATAEPKSPSSSAALRFPFLNFWRQQLQRSPEAQASGRARRHSSSTSCLPDQLQATLAGVQARFGPVTVISTHRPGARIRGGRPSLHASCRAVDFKPAPGTYGKVATYLRNTWSGGIGTYSSGHIHIDMGDNYRWHSGGRQNKRR